ESDECYQSDEMQAAGPLPPAEKPREPLKATGARGRHRQTRGDLQRCQHEHEGEVRELLKAVVGTAWRRNVEAQVRDDSLTRFVEHCGGARHEPGPTLPCEQYQKIRNPSQQPADDRREMPEASQAEVVSARQRQPRSVRFLLVLSGPA